MQDDDVTEDDVQKPKSSEEMLREFRASVADTDDDRADTEPLIDDLDTELGDSLSATQVAEALASAEVEDEAAPDLSGTLPPPPPPLPHPRRETFSPDLAVTRMIL